MPTKTKTKRQSKKQRKTTGKRRTAKKTARKSLAVKAKPRARKTAGAKTKKTAKKKVQRKKPRAGAVTFSLKSPEVRSGRQSGDLQALSEVEGADSESVAELLEEGNTFEAEVVSGVEAADSGEREVQTHEVPEDDVPDEYLDKK